MYLTAFSDHGKAPAFTVNALPPLLAQSVSESDVSVPIPAPGSPVPDLNLPPAAAVAHTTDLVVTVSVIVTFPDCLPVKEPPGETLHPVAVTADDDVALSATASAAVPAASSNEPRCVRMRLIPPRSRTNPPSVRMPCPAALLRGTRPGWLGLVAGGLHGVEEGCGFAEGGCGGVDVDAVGVGGFGGSRHLAGGAVGGGDFGVGDDLRVGGLGLGGRARRKGQPARSATAERPGPKVLWCRRERRGLCHDSLMTAVF